ncbi:2-oxoglutarate dehydrogenase, E2 component, dihydrolipoamide succinyltransferase [Canibacter sp. lx-72]|uniref:2-oxoglutarate dehydrogenase, E2 component, dihydrolipoamide succinyltransferase n=1 Tax=Canibacter zhuwentaonis TaxID=2837491 RepID=UPI001BDBF003|nr:2-oxoglutarate dehydrogenase, E2 component, dihydrolipoamide succinyltransferase [Canibacter zhuwentaonis]MBT1017987.1 2-oxoglutarate dehydrogenase, E2 component, dihydrolipoamide succinyltransferase [Canibacter zhuwentaonis]MBT1035147.1 2-oxoglutarate dehydrogenase, E2 component, dihydrolipoamide succinyltransferase [Canibacter zhuwentaonis]
MSEEVILPALGESVTEGTVTQWLKKVGDKVAVDEPLLEISTDKVDTEVPSPVAGVLEEILVAEDETVEVGAVLARVGDGSSQSTRVESEPRVVASESTEPEETAAADSQETAPEPASEPKPAPEPEPKPAPAPAPEPATAKQEPQNAPAASAPASPAKPFASPHSAARLNGYVTPISRKLANELNVDLSTVKGTGVGGRIRKEDIRKAAAAQSSAQGIAGTGVASKPEEFKVSELRGTSQKMSRLRKVVAERAVESLQNTAQLTTVVKVDVTRVAKLRAAKKDEFLTKTGNKLSFMPFFALAAVEALQTYPIINSTVKDDEIIYPDSENLSIAVDSERGLLTPVISAAASKSIAELAASIADLADRTRNNKLKPDELVGGTFTLTNTGSRGALFDTPLVFLPQSAILGTGVVVKEPGVVATPEGDVIGVRSYVYLALSYDHRTIDGADAARFLTQVKQRLEAGNFEPNLGI